MFRLTFSAQICTLYGEENTVLVSALSECFLQKMIEKKYIRYDGTDAFKTNEEDNELIGIPEKVTRMSRLFSVLCFY
jgi:hypothetical protein